MPETAEDETPAAQEGLGGEAEVEMEVEPAPEGMEEQGWRRPVFLFLCLGVTRSFFFPFVSLLSGGSGEKETLGYPHYDARKGPSGDRKWVYL